MKKLKRLIINLIGNYRFGLIEYYLRPAIKEVWGGGFNGQQFRKKIFNELVQLFKFSAIIETGTHRGSTTEYMADITNIPIYTVESNPRFYAFAEKRFSKSSQIHTSLNDSRTFLKELSIADNIINGSIFFYLDAHWGEDLPLAEEINIIFNTWEDAVIMIDDFQVPGDSGYGYQFYTSGKNLSLVYLDALLEYNYYSFFPNITSENETGAKRGCVILIKNDAFLEKLKTAKTLRMN